MVFRDIHAFFVSSMKMPYFISRVKTYSSLVKLSHVFFSLPFAIIGFFLAIKNYDSGFQPLTFALMLLCVFFARNAAMSFNRIADRKIDSVNPRTSNREIPSGKISLKYARIFLIVNIILFLLSAFFINLLCFILAPLALLLILGYSYSKRFTFFSHFILGAGLALAPTGAYIAASGNLSIIPILYSLAVLFWVAGFDIIYALQDKSFDMEQKLKSVPSVFGTRKSLVISAVSHLFSLFFLILAGIIFKNNLFFWLGTIIFTIIIIYQHIFVNIKDADKKNLSFMRINGLSGVLFMFFVLLDLYFPYNKMVANIFI